MAEYWVWFKGLVWRVVFYHFLALLALLGFIYWDIHRPSTITKSPWIGVVVIDEVCYINHNTILTPEISNWCFQNGALETYMLGAW